MKIFFDENFSKYIAAALNCLQKGYRGDDFEVLHIAEVMGKGALDEDWIPKVAQMHGVIITADSNIYRTRSLHELCLYHKTGIFFFRHPKKAPFTYWRWVEITLKHWANIKDLALKHERPFAFEITPRSNVPEPMK